MSTSQSSPPPRRRSVAAIVIGGVVTLIAVSFLAAGAALFWGESEKDADGYLSTGSDRFATTTHALATEDLELGDRGAGWIVDQDAYGKVRLRVEPQADKPVFVGIAPTDRVESYLAGSRHTTVTDVDYSPFRAEYRDSAPPAAPRRRRRRTSGPRRCTAAARRRSPGTSSRAPGPSS